jgi:flagellar hook-associated protein 1 FlgK
MGGGLNAALNSGRTSLQTNQKAIEITGLNIANVNTEGYSRQTPYLTPYPALNFGDFFIGTGVKVGSVQRSHDVFLDGQIKDKSADVGLESSMASPLAELERVIGIGDGSLSDEFDQYFDAWRQLSTNPGGEVERQAVLQRGELISNAFVNVYNETQQVVKNVNNTIVSKVDGVNLRLDEIAQLNNRISAIEMSGQEANSDRDRRDLLLKDLSESIGARSFETSTGTVSVQLANGMPLVEGDKATHIISVYSGTDVNLELDFGTTTIPLDRTALGGEFRGLYDVRDVTIPDVVDRLDQLAYAFATEVNAQHQAGNDLNGNPGSAFFVPPSIHTSQGYDDPAASNFGIGNIMLNINGTETTVVIDGTNNSVNGIAAAIDAVAGVSASVDPTDNSLVVVPDTSGDNVLIDTSDLSGGSYLPPSFTSADMSASLAMNITQTSQIAAGTTPPPGAPGDNTNALAILDLEQAQLPGLGGNDTLVSYYGKIAATVGVEAARNRQAQQGHNDSLIQLQNMRDGIDGVSLEDEMINLMQYQKGFEASAKFLATVDEMMGTLLTLKR